MRIFYIGKFGLEHNTENYVSHALKQEGHIVHKYHVKAISWTHFKRVLETFNPEMVLFSKAYFAHVQKIIRYCHLKGIPSVCWQWDYFIGYRSNRPDQFWCDFLFTTDGGHDKEWEKMGANHYLLRQGIHEPEAVQVEADFNKDTAFVGGSVGHPSRKKLIRWLHSQRRGGMDWIWYYDKRGMNLNKVLSQTRIVIGDSYPGVNYWSNRIYEITGRGGFLLHPHTEGLEEEYQEGVHYVGYERGNYKQLRELIDHYLKEDFEREKIREAGFRHTRENYTYTHRVKTLLETVGLVPQPS